MLYLWIMLGSALGGGLRFWVATTIGNQIGETFPWGTIIVNFTGSFVIGFFATLTGPDGRLCWFYRWSWGEVLCDAEDPPAAAAKIADVLAAR